MISRSAAAKARSVHVLSRALSSRAATVLNALDIPTAKEVPGVYDGTWTGSGEVLESVCPTTGEVLARVQAVRAALHCKACLPLMRGRIGFASGASDGARKIERSVQVPQVRTGPAQG